VFAYATKLEGVLLYVFMAIMFVIVASILFFMYLTFSKKYDYNPRPDFKKNYKPDYNSKSFTSSKRGISGLVKAFIMAFAFLTLLGLCNYFFDVFSMFYSGLDFIEGLIEGALGTPVVKSVVDMIVDGITKS